MAAAPNIHLYEATEQLRTVGDWLLESGGEMTPEIEALLAEAEGTFREKAERVALYIRELEVTSAAIKGRAGALRTEPDRLDKLAKGYADAAARLKKYLTEQMQAAEIDMIEGDFVWLKLKKNPPAVHGELTDLALATCALDARFLAMIDHVPASYVLDKSAVIAAWKAGRELPPGLAVEQATRVVIK